MSTFRIRIVGKRARKLKVKSSIYRDAAAAAPAIFGWPLPVDVEIWAPHLLPEYGPYFYRIRDDEYGRLITEHLIPECKR